MKNYLQVIVTCALVFLVAQSNGQEAPVNPIDTLSQKIESIESDLSLIKKIKLSGYIQAQYQKADTAGISSVSGDDFGAAIDQRFNIRRGRIKTVYTGKASEIGIQLDVTEKGVGLKEAYFKVRESLLNIATLQGGLFNRPFGFEVSFSSAAMEAPERARIVQALFPGETDLGFSVVLQAPKTSALNVLKLEAGLFNGAYNKTDIDNYKDFIGRLSYNNSLFNELVKLGLGASYYNGKLGKIDTAYTWNDTAYTYLAGKNMSSKREYFGLDAQVSVESVIGISTLRAEYIWGQQPVALGKSTKTPIDPISKPISYSRNFQGGYLYFVQSLGQSKHKLVAKYDWYDQNTDVKGDEIVSKTSGGKSTGLSVADIAYNTLGLGWMYSYDENLRFTTYYDMVNNEKTKLKDYSKDLKDNVITLRVQYKF